MLAHLKIHEKILLFAQTGLHYNDQKLSIEMRIGVFVFESSSLGREKPPPAADTNPYIFDQTQLSSAKYK